MKQVRHELQVQRITGWRDQYVNCTQGKLCSLQQTAIDPPGPCF